MSPTTDQDATKTNRKDCPLPVYIRDMTAEDVPGVINIEKASFTNPWTVEDLRRCLRQRNHFAFVATAANRVVGFIILESTARTIFVVNFVVHPEYRRRGVGDQMLTWLIEQLRQTRRSRISMEIRETNLGMQLFLRSGGFKAVQVLRNYFADSGEDAYQFDYVAAGKVKSNAD